jgi:transposase
VDEGIFLEFLQKLSDSMGGKPFALFMDRLTVHRMLTVREKMESLNILCILNIAASPDLNAIETCFAQCKRHYKKERLNALVNDREFDVED